MKLPLTLAALLLSLTTFAPTASAQKKCSCDAPDGSCKAAVTCRHAGAAICGSKSACYAACGGVEADNSAARISVKFRKKTGDEVAAELKRHSGRNIVFIPRRKKDRFTFELDNHPVWHALSLLSRRGKVLVDGTPFNRMQELRRKLSGGEKVSVNFTDIPVRSAVARLSFLSGLPLRVGSGDAEKLISVSLEEVTLDEIVARVSAEAGVKIERAGQRASAK